MQVSFSIVVAFLFLLLLLLVALLLVAMLLKENQEKQKAYTVFSGYLGDFLITMSKEGRLLDATPKYVSDPLYEQILQKH